MADAPAVRIGENSPEEVAHKLMQEVMRAEGKATYTSEGVERVDRKYLLDTYAECLMAVARPWDRRPK